MFLAICLAWAGRCVAATPEQIDDALQRACSYLRKVEGPSGDWEVREASTEWGVQDIVIAGKFRGGLTAMALWALLSNGDHPSDPKIASAIDTLKKLDMRQVYSLSCRCQIWSMLPPSPEIKRLADKDARALLSMMHQKGEATGLFYYDRLPAETYDHSVSQFAVLGISTCESMGIEVPASFWRITDQAWRRHQDATGGWAYINGDPKRGAITPSMTAAGIASLFISKSALLSQRSADATGNVVDPEIDRGLAWFRDHFEDVFADRDEFPKTRTYTLFGVARIGVASGYKYFGTINWFERGADWLVKHQNGDGSWGGGKFDFWNQNHDNVPATAFAILFLLRGRAPVMINKLDYASNTTAAVPAKSTSTSASVNTWNTRPRDAYNLARWAGNQVERELNWQVVNLNVPVAELQDAPILLMDGSSTIELSEQQELKLRQFVEEGGLILGNADNGSPTFEKSFIKLGQKLFPAYEFRRLPEDHPIYTAEQFIAKKWPNQPNLSGLSNGVRELMLLSSKLDLSRSWQQNPHATSDPALELGTDIYLYTVGHHIPRWKNDAHGSVVQPPPAKEISRNITRLQYQGNWNPEPAGWRIIKPILHDQYHINLNVATAELGKDPLPPGGIVHITGTGAVTWRDNERAALKKFVDDGGTILIDAAGGSSGFATSIEDNLKLTFGTEADQLHTPLPLESELYTQFGRPIGEMRFRSFGIRIVGASRQPRIRAMKWHGRIAVLYSAEDLSYGLIGHDVDGVVGYDSESALSLMANMLSLSANSKANAAQSQ